MNADIGKIARFMTDGEVRPMRVGRKVKRTLYLVDMEANDPAVDLCIGIVDSEDLAAEICRRWNGD